MAHGIFVTNKDKDEFTFAGQTKKTDLASASKIASQVTGEKATSFRKGESPSVTTKNHHIDFIPKSDIKGIIVNKK